MQPFIQPLVARSSTPFTSAPQRSSINHRFRLAPVNLVAAPLTPFQAALLFMQYKQHAAPKAAAYVAFLADGQLLAVEWLHNQRGHNPSVNIDRVVRRAKHHRANQAMLATWVHSTSETPYAVEFEDEVIYQHAELEDNGLDLIDSLRLSETGMYSYYGDHNGPYANTPTFYDRSINRHYHYGH